MTCVGSFWMSTIYKPNFHTDTNALISDYNYLPEDKDLQLVQSCIRLSANVLARDARQLAGQLTGRLLGIDDRGLRIF